ncbi:DHA2 family efflux MFS transporter permease subunit [Mycobacterium sp.]|uniref:DHA2 family efflux MFS transporter permease subunit n=1 Tax=Mycobacterium sp. TaxID=1785 RepID=UPI003C7478B2
MLSYAMENTRLATSDPPVPTASTGHSDADEHEYPDKLDAALLRIGAVCAVAAVMAMLDATAVNVAQRTFINQFGSTQAVVGWTIAGYMLAFVTVIPMIGWGADRFGSKRLFMGSTLVFTLGSLLCAMAPTILLLIVFRVVQGIGGGILLPLGVVILSREAGPRRLGRLMALGAIPMLLGPMGPILGGWLIGTYGWKWIFLVNLPIGLAVFALAAILFPKDRPVAPEAFDLVGMLLLPPGVAAFLVGVSSIPGRGTVADHRVLIPAVIGLALIAAFVVHAWYRAERPLIDLRLFKNRVVARANVTMLTFGVAFVGTGVLVPSYFQQVLHQTPMQSGMHLVPVGIGAIVATPLAGVFTDRRGPRTIVLVGIPLVAAGLAIFTFGVARHTDYRPTLLVALAIMGMGLGCITMPLSAAVLQSLAPHQIARGTTLISVNQQIAGSMGAALMSVLLTSQFNRSESIVVANKMASVQQDADRRGVPVDPSAIPRQALAPDFASNVVHHLSHAYAAVFVVAVVLVASTILPAAFLPKRPAHQTLTIDA